MNMSAKMDDWYDKLYKMTQPVLKNDFDNALELGDICDFLKDDLDSLSRKRKKILHELRKSSPNGKGGNLETEKSSFSELQKAV